MKLSLPILLLLLVGLIPLTAQANKPLPVEVRQTINQTMRLSSQLDLSNEESQQLMAVILEFNKQRQAIREQVREGKGMKDAPDQLAKIDQEQEKAIAAALSPEKAKQWEWNKTKARWKGYYRQGQQYWLMGLGLIVGGAIGWSLARRKYNLA